MTKGHNQEPGNQETNQQGQQGKDQNQKPKNSHQNDDRKGRNADPDPSNGTKGQNAI